MDLADNSGIEIHPVVFWVGVESLVSPLDSVNVSDLIVEPKTHSDLSDDDIETWTKTATRHDQSFNFWRVEVNLLFWSCLQQLAGLRQVLQRSVVLPGHDKAVAGHERVCWHKPASIFDGLFVVISDKGTFEPLDFFSVL